MNEQISTAFVVGGVVQGLTLMRALLVLSQEFSSSDVMIQDPIATLVNPTLTYDQFKGQNWKAFVALCAALRFRQFYVRYRAFLDPTLGVVSLFSVLAVYLVLWVVVREAGLGSGPETAVGALGGLAASAWIVLIEYGKTLKRTALQLKV